ncbi:Lipase-3 domain-containing protein [Mycena indigotica]|uniref:Lipase-3 domain-containing protein n=1 Tax=Mycena indigotica TaxID=2126181 RepID=A0A8H6T6U8_9AGAR|nr:Lipase-3 domain-containing protein [Mycena indigotica]KAF7311869.1 Lipase-3 domain-containing protein [Mycena indigotica]
MVTAISRFFSTAMASQPAHVLATSASNTENEPAPITADIFADLLHYFKYASSAYSPVCLRPNGNALVLQFGNQLSDIQGFIARDDHRKELVVALRGSASITDILLDAAIVLVPFLTPGVKLPAGARVHAGFLTAWDTVAPQITAALAVQRQLHPGHRLVTVGHSLGGALATLAAVSLLQLFTASPILDQTRTYSYGAPRAGNTVFADWVNEEMGSRAFRVVHADDGVPTMIPTSLGYHHHGNGSNTGSTLTLLTPRTLSAVAPPAKTPAVLRVSLPGE